MDDRGGEACFNTRDRADTSQTTRRHRGFFTPHLHIFIFISLFSSIVLHSFQFQIISKPSVFHLMEFPLSSGVRALPVTRRHKCLICIKWDKISFQNEIHTVGLLYKILGCYPEGSLVLRFRLF